MSGVLSIVVVFLYQPETSQTKTWHDVPEMRAPAPHCPVVMNGGQLSNPHVYQDHHKVHHLIFNSGRGSLDVL